MTNGTAEAGTSGSAVVGIQPDAPTPDNTDAYLSALANEAARAALPVETDESGQPRDPSGRFVALPKDGEEQSEEQVEDATTDTDSPEEQTTESATEDGETPAVPALPTLSRDPIVPLAVKMGETALEGVPDLTITFKGPGGKERTEPLDKVVRLAMDGIYSETREQRYRSLESEATTAKAQLAEYEAALAQQQQFVDALLADEARYLTEKDSWDRQHTPEARAMRAQEQLRMVQEQHQMERIAQQGEQYFQTQLTPAIDALANHLPMVTPEELVARVSLEVQRVQGRRGYVTPDQYRQIDEFILHDLAPWAQQLNQARNERFAPKTTQPDASAAIAKAEAKATAAVTSAQKAKSQVAKAIKPVGKAAPDAVSRRPARQPQNTDEAIEDAVSAAINATLGR